MGPSPCPGTMIPWNPQGGGREGKMSPNSYLGLGVAMILLCWIFMMRDGKSGGKTPRNRFPGRW